jgi:hypothetical protein
MTHSQSYRRILSRMGYYDYQNGLIYRHLNQEGGWDNHLEKCRRFVSRAIEFYKPEKVTVLGSGWLLELPLAEMVEKSIKVRLLDIVHPPDVIKQTGNLKNVELVELDLTGGLVEEVWQKAGKYRLLNKLKSLKNIVIPEFNTEDDPGMVISLNLLTQLESLPVDLLRKRSKVSEDEITRFRAEIQTKHIDFLKKYKSVLISDYNETFTSKSIEIESVKTLLADLPNGIFKEEWTWEFDLKGVDFYTRRSEMQVVALII